MSYLRNHKFKHSFQDTLNPLWNFGSKVETSALCLLHFPANRNERLTLLNKIKNNSFTVLEKTTSILTQIPPNASFSFDFVPNAFLKTAQYIVASKGYFWCIWIKVLKILKIFGKLTRKNLCRSLVLFLMKLQALGIQCEIFKNSFLWSTVGCFFMLAMK